MIVLKFSNLWGQKTWTSEKNTRRFVNAIFLETMKERAFDANANISESKFSRKVSPPADDRISYFHKRIKGPHRREAALACASTARSSFVSLCRRGAVNCPRPTSGVGWSTRRAFRFQQKISKRYRFGVSVKPSASFPCISFHPACWNSPLSHRLVKNAVFFHLIRSQTVSIWWKSGSWARGVRHGVASWSMQVSWPDCWRFRGLRVSWRLSLVEWSHAVIVGIDSLGSKPVRYRMWLGR